MSAPPGVDHLTHRLATVPRLVDHDAPDAGVRARARILPALSVAHAAGATVVAAWLRLAPRGRVAVLTGGLPHETGDGDVALSFPAGALGRRITQADTAKGMARIASWVAADLALDAAADPTGAALGPALEDVFSLLPDRALGFVVVARPRPVVELQIHLDGLSDTVAQLEAQRTGRGYARLALERAEAELAYFERVGAGGTWDLEVWAGGATPEEAHGVVALLGAGSDLAEVPLVMRPASAGRATGEEGLSWAPRRAASGDCVAALLRPPSRELPGIVVRDVPDFDVTPEVSGPVALGRVWDATRTPSMPFTIPLDSVNRHVFVTGATGSGKSQTVRSLLQALTGQGVPWMVIEPAKSEYAQMAGRVAPGEVTVIRPGRRDQVPASLNPLEPSSITVDGTQHRFPLQTHLDLTRALFTASFQADDPFPQILATALTMAYENLGWDLAMSAPVGPARAASPRWPTLSDVQREALAAVDAIGYGKDVRDNVQGFVRVRIDSLRTGTPGRFFEGGHPLDVQALLDRNVVFEIEDVGDARDQAFFIGTVVIRVFEVLRLKEAHGLLPKGLAHVTVVEEAHRLLQEVDESSVAGQAVTMFANLLAEVRAYGEGIVVAEQIPAKVIADVVKNSAVKVMHRLPAADDREVVGATMNLSETQSELVVSLPPGVAAVHSEGMDRPILVAIDGSGAAGEGRAARLPHPPVGARGPACPSACRSEPCRFERLVPAQRLARDPRLVLWAEIVTAAHVLGQAPRSVGTEVTSRLEAVDPEMARCALGILADAAVDRRHRALLDDYDPTALRKQVVTIMRRQWTEGFDAPAQGPTWTAATFRWIDVTRTLVDAVGRSPSAPPHPDTAAWRGRGLDLAGATVSAQLAEVRAVTRRAAARERAAIVGAEPVILGCVDALGRGDDLETRMVSALRSLGLPSHWPSKRLPARLVGEGNHG